MFPALKNVVAPRVNKQRWRDVAWQQVCADMALQKLHDRHSAQRSCRQDIELDVLRSVIDPAIGKFRLDSEPADEVRKVLLCLWNREYYQWYKSRYATKTPNPKRNPDVYREVSKDLRLLLEASTVPDFFMHTGTFAEHGWFMFLAMIMLAARPLKSREVAPVAYQDTSTDGTVDMKEVFRGLNNLPTTVIASHLRLGSGQNDGTFGFAPPQSFSINEEAAREFSSENGIMYNCTVQQPPDPTSANASALSGIVLWHLSAWPEEMEVLTAPFCILRATGQDFAGGRLSVRAAFSKTLFSEERNGGFLEWVKEMRAVADKRLTGAEPPSRANTSPDPQNPTVVLASGGSPAAPVKVESWQTAELPVAPGPLHAGPLPSRQSVLGDVSMSKPGLRQIRAATLRGIQDGDATGRVADHPAREPWRQSTSRPTAADLSAYLAAESAEYNTARSVREPRATLAPPKLADFFALPTRGSSSPPPAPASPGLSPSTRHAYVALRDDGAAAGVAAGVGAVPLIAPAPADGSRRAAAAGRLPGGRGIFKAEGTRRV